MVWSLRAAVQWHAAWKDESICAIRRSRVAGALALILLDLAEIRASLEVVRFRIRAIPGFAEM